MSKHEKCIVCMSAKPTGITVIFHLQQALLPDGSPALEAMGFTGATCARCAAASRSIANENGYKKLRDEVTLDAVAAMRIVEHINAAHEKEEHSNAAHEEKEKN